MENELKQLKEQALAAISAAKDLKVLQEIQQDILGRKGKLTGLLNEVGKLSADVRPAMGKLGNTIKKELQAVLEEAEKKLHQTSAAEPAKALGAGLLDPSLPGYRLPKGSIHPITQAMAEIVDILTGMGFWVELGPDAETDYNNFEALNIPKDHPARDMQATFFLSEDIVLRTHTSPVQIRGMLKHKPPVRIISPGRVYRCDSDLSHSPMFHQVEGLMVDKGISMGHLKGVLMAFIHEYFGPQVKVRFRPSYFPFTEPSAEVDIACVICEGQGCPVCKKTGWMEVLGSGMVNPHVLMNVGYDPEELTGFAFGLGVERLSMLKYHVDNIRTFYENDIRFLSQF